MHCPALTMLNALRISLGWRRILGQLVVGRTTTPRSKRLRSCWCRRFRSVVRRTSKSSSARLSSWPFSSVAQPCSYAVATEWPGSRLRRGTGVPWSNRTRTGRPDLRRQTSSGILQHAAYLCARHAWKPLNKIVDRCPVFQVVEQSSNRDAGSLEDPTPAHTALNLFHRLAVTPTRHSVSLARLHRCDNTIRFF